MSITHVTSLSQLDKLLANPSKITVIDFHATWCGPCHMIAPTFEALSKQYPDVNFVKVDVDEAQEVSGRYRIRSMPSFVFFKGADEVARVQGANRDKLTNTVARLSSPASSAFSGTGQTLGGSSSSKSAGAAPRHTGSDVGLDPQLKVLLLLVAGYLAFWYLS